MGVKQPTLFFEDFLFLIYYILLNIYKKKLTNCLLYNKLKTNKRKIKTLNKKINRFKDGSYTEQWDSFYQLFTKIDFPLVKGTGQYGSFFVVGYLFTCQQRRIY